MRTILPLLIITFIFQTSYSQDNEEKFYTLEYYNKKENNVKLDFLIDVKSSLDTLTLYGYKNKDNSTLHKRKIKLDRGQVLAVSNWSYFGNFWHWKPIPISITTVPFKVRPGFDEFKTFANSEIKNVGLNVDLFRWQTERYFSTSKKSTHKFYTGIWVAPSVEELDSTQTRGFLMGDTKSKQLFVSTALTLNYTYNNITFTFVPIGLDIATNSIGKEWVYNKRRWWGFGIGLEPKIFSTILNK